MGVHGHFQHTPVALDGRPAGRDALSAELKALGGSSSSLSDGSDPVVTRVVLDLGEADCLEYGRHVVAESAAQALLEAVPTTHRVVSVSYTHLTLPTIYSV